MDRQLNMFGDLRFWSANDLVDYHRQCLGDLNNLTALYDANLIHLDEREKYDAATSTLREEIAAIHSELALRALLAQ